MRPLERSKPLISLLVSWRLSVLTVKSRSLWAISRLFAVTSPIANNQWVRETNLEYESELVWHWLYCSRLWLNSFPDYEELSPHKNHFRNQHKCCRTLHDDSQKSPDLQDNAPVILCENIILKIVNWSDKSDISWNAKAPGHLQWLDRLLASFKLWGHWRSKSRHQNWDPVGGYARAIQGLYDWRQGSLFPKAPPASIRRSTELRFSSTSTKNHRTQKLTSV